MTIRMILSHGFVAEVVSEDDDRLPYVPPPVTKGEHAITCQCVACVMARTGRGKPA